MAVAVINRDAFQFTLQARFDTDECPIYIDLACTPLRLPPTRASSAVNTATAATAPVSTTAAREAIARVRTDARAAEYAALPEPQGHPKKARTNVARSNVAPAALAATEPPHTTRMPPLSQTHDHRAGTAIATRPRPPKGTFAEPSPAWDEVQCAAHRRRTFASPEPAAAATPASAEARFAAHCQRTFALPNQLSAAQLAVLGGWRPSEVRTSNASRVLPRAGQPRISVH